MTGQQLAEFLRRLPRRERVAFEQDWEKYERGNRRANRQYEVESLNIDHRYQVEMQPEDWSADPRYEPRYWMENRTTRH